MYSPERFVRGPGEAVRKLNIATQAVKAINSMRGDRFININVTSIGITVGFNLAKLLEELPIQAGSSGSAITLTRKKIGSTPVAYDGGSSGSTHPTSYEVVPLSVDEWSSDGVSYSVGDVVSYNSVYYICITAHTTSSGSDSPDNSANWNQDLDTAEVLGITFTSLYELYPLLEKDDTVLVATIDSTNYIIEPDFVKVTAWNDSEGYYEGSSLEIEGRLASVFR